MSALRRDVDRYVALRRELDRVADLADAAFLRWFRKRERGEQANGAAATKLANRVSYLSADLVSAESPLYAADLDPDKIYELAATLDGVPELLTEKELEELTDDELVALIVERTNKDEGAAYELLQFRRGTIPEGTIY